jgi:hypothetical protein
LFDQNGKNPPERAFQSANSKAIDCPSFMQIDETLQSAVLTAIIMLI